MSRLVTRLLVSLAVLLPLSVPGVAGAAAGPDRELTVMSQNLYLGSDLTPAITAASQQDFLIAVATIYQTVLFTNFPVRAEAIADQIDADRPDLIGLQEVSRWTAFGDTPVPSLDFLAILQAELAARGLHYDVAAVSNNASIGPVPLVFPCGGPVGDCALLFQDRDVILVNTDTAGLAVGNARSGTYLNQQILATPVGSLSFARGWATVDGTFWGQRFRFANTHLETEDFPVVQQAQGREFLAVARTPGAVLAVGDFNSATDGSTTTTYADVTADYFRDAWSGGAGLTCCQNSSLTNPVSNAHSRIDLVLTHALHPLEAHLVGDAPFQAAPPFWPSDHVGVVATLRLH